MIRVDSNHIAVQIASAKISNFNVNQSLENIQNIMANINLNKKIKMPENAAKFFHEKTANQIMHLKEYYEEFNDYRFSQIMLSSRYLEMYQRMLELGEELAYLQSVDLISEKTVEFFREDLEVVKAIFDDSNLVEIINTSSYVHFPRLCEKLHIQKNATNYNKIEKKRVELSAIEKAGMA